MPELTEAEQAILRARCRVFGPAPEAAAFGLAGELEMLRASIGIAPEHVVTKVRAVLATLRP